MKGATVIFSEKTEWGTEELKVLWDHKGPIPRPGERIAFLDGCRTYEVVRIGWITYSTKGHALTCRITLKGTERWNGIMTNTHRKGRGAGSQMARCLGLRRAHAML